MSQDTIKAKVKKKATEDWADMASDSDDVRMSEAKRWRGKKKNRDNRSRSPKSTGIETSAPLSKGSSNSRAKKRVEKMKLRRSRYRLRTELGEPVMDRYRKTELE